MARAYGVGSYGAGRYGQPDYQTPATPIAPLPNVLAANRKPLHILGIGPWSNAVEWRGAPNFGISARARDSVPLIGLPQAQTTTLTVRLEGGSEARTDHTVPRNKTIFIEEMATDLWWRRTDPSLGTTSMLARLNADSVDISQGDTNDTVKVSVAWTDYAALLGDRLILRYKDSSPTYQTQWAKGTLVTDILRWAVPTNLGIDLTAIQASTAANLGVTKVPYELPLATTIDDTMSTLQAASEKQWAWWIDQPANPAARPTLTFAVGTRGRDTGITLADDGSGTGPITRWSMQSSATQYANVVYYIGGTGGSIWKSQPDINAYGQRDISESNAALKGNKDRIDLAAQTKLAETLDRRPSWTLTLAPGFWRGPSHLWVGDTVTVSITCGAAKITNVHRITEMTITVTDTGDETVDITVGTPRNAGDPRSRRSINARLVRRVKNYERASGAISGTPEVGS